MSTNRISVELTEQELTDIQAALASIRAILEPKMINLTAAERRQFGSLGDERTAWVQKVRNYAGNNTNLVPFFVDLAEHEKDAALFENLTPLFNDLAQLTDMVSDTRLLAGYDIYQNSLSIYNYIALLAQQQNVPGISPIYEDLKKEFPGGRSSNTDDGDDDGGSSDDTGTP